MGTLRKRYVQRHAALEMEQQSWVSHWRELSDYIQPRRARFLSTDRNKGSKQNGSIINGTPIRALRILASGMMAGITSPARPWFRLGTPDPDLAEVGSVRAWLHVCEERLRTSFARSNIYNCLHSVYVDLGQYGTSACSIEDDATDVLRGYNFPVGQYCLALGPTGRVDTLFRRFSMTVGQVVKRFGLEECSDGLSLLYQRGKVDEWVEVIHAIEPNDNMQTGQADHHGMPWRSCWMEAAGGDHDGFLREGGFEEFPILAPRWAVNGEDIYGSGPGMDALGDAKALQLLEKRKAQAIDKIVNPAMKGPTSLYNQAVSLLPGAVTYVDVPHGGQSLEPAFLVPPAAIGVVGAEIQRHEQRINSAFFADLWMMLAEGGGTNITAREVAERHEEKMLQLGPVMERLQSELLDPLIDRAFGILLRRGLIPEPPEEIQGVELRVEYTSTMAQAQKLLATSGIERLASFAGNLAAVRPDVLDKLNWDEMVDDYASSLGTKPDLVLSDDEVARVRKERAAAAQAQRQGEAALAAAQGAQTLSKTDMGGDTALTRLMGAMGGPAATAAGK